jgi:hypothetical protein
LIASAKAAIARAGELMNGQAATVLTVWEPFVDVMTRTGAGLSLMPDMVDFAQLADASERSVRERAQEGVGVANDAGLKASPGSASDTPRSRTRSWRKQTRSVPKASSWGRAG